MNMQGRTIFSSIINNIITFVPNSLPSDKEKVSRGSNQIAYFQQKHLSGSEFLVNVTAPNKELDNYILLSRSSVHKSIS